MKKPLNLPSFPHYQRLFILVLTCFYCTSALNAQRFEPRFKTPNSEAKFTNGGVSAILQDSRGYIWSGSSYGLNRYSGLSNTIFDSIEEGLLEKLPDVGVKSLVEDVHGKIWIGTRNGLARYDPILNVILNFTDIGDCENCLAGRVITSMLLDGHQIWIGTNAGLSVVNVDSHQIRSWWYKEGSETIDTLFAIRDMIHFDDENILLASNIGLIKFSKKDNNFTFFADKQGLLTPGLGCVFKDSKGRVWLGSDKDGIYKMDGSIDEPYFRLFPKLIPSEKIKTTVYDIIEDDQNRLWFGTYEGLTVYDEAINNISFHYHQVDIPNSLLQNTVKELYIDRQSRVWIGSPGGLNYYDPYYHQFKVYRHQKNNPNSLSSDKVFSILEDKEGWVWAGMQNSGVSIIKRNEKDPKLQFFHLNKGIGPKSLKGKQVYALGEDPKGRIWMSIPSGLHILEWIDRDNMDYKISIVEEGSLAENKLPNSNIYEMYFDESDRAWLATHGSGIITIDKNGKKGQIKYSNQNPLHSSKDYVITVARDLKGRMWLGNYNIGGTVILDPKQDSTYYKILGSSAFYLKNVNDYAFIDTTILISTAEGLFQYNVDSLLRDTLPGYIRYTTNDGLPSNFVSELVVVNDTTVWFSTTGGIAKLNPKRQHIKSYQYQLGEEFGSFYHNASHLGKDSTIYFGGSNGLVYFKSKEILENTEKPIIHFKDFRILNKKIPIASETLIHERSISRDIAFLDQINLSSKEKIFTIDIEIINHRGNEALKVWYFLEGFDEEWVQSDNLRITRSNLSAGDYTLFAKAQNNDGYWSEEISLKIKVEPSWYASWWAILAYLGFALGIVYGVSSFRLNKAEFVEKVKREERQIFRKRSSQDFHDEAGTRLTRIALLTELLKRKIEVNQPVDDVIMKIEHNIENLNIGMRDFIWSLDPEKDNLYEILMRFTDFAREFCDAAEIRFKSEPLSVLLKDFESDMSSKRHILLILKEAINNSVKHSNCSEISLGNAVHGNKAILKFSDNGVGIRNGTKSKGNGMENMRFRASEINASIEINSKDNKGTYILISIPKSLN